MFKIGTLLALTASAASAEYTNSVPLSGHYPGWFEGDNKADIRIELFFDLLCGDCKKADPAVTAMMEHEWLDGQVKDYVRLSHSLFPLPYHEHAW